MSEHLHFRITPHLAARVGRAADHFFDRKSTIIRGAVKIGVQFCRDFEPRDWSSRGWPSENTVYVSVRCPGRLLDRMTRMADERYLKQADIARAALATGLDWIAREPSMLWKAAVD
jgi:predicted transcriptional regulator